MTATARKILVPLDGSANGERAVDHLIALAATGAAAELHLLNVQRPVSGDVSAFVGKKVLEGYHYEEGMKALAPAAAKLEAAGIPFHRHIVIGDPGETIAQFCETLGCDGIVIGARGLGGAVGLLLGSVAMEAIRRAKVPVTLVK